MGLQLWDNGPSWQLESAPADSARFGLAVARLRVRRSERQEDENSTELAAALRAELAQVVICRYPADSWWVAAALVASGRNVLPAGGLVYWRSPAGAADQNPPARGRDDVDVVTADVAALGSAGDRLGRVGDQRRTAGLLDELVGGTFDRYGSHYRHNPLFDPDAIAAGYAEWTRAVLASDTGEVLVLRLRGEPIGFASLAPDGDGYEILLAGISPAQQGRGHYRELLDACARWSAAHGGKSVVISTQTHNVRVQRAWANAGWRPVDALETVHLVTRGLLPSGSHRSIWLSEPPDDPETRRGAPHRERTR